VERMPSYRRLGGYKESVPCYASTYHGDQARDGLSSPEAYAEFAVQCRERGYPAFKIHGWGRAPIAQEIATVLAVREKVGPGMALMLRAFSLPRETGQNEGHRGSWPTAERA
jgi:L-alanine-DL-glutamate epimerase-like enolase superfamily enzyme